MKKVRSDPFNSIMQFLEAMFAWKTSLETNVVFFLNQISWLCHLVIACKWRRLLKYCPEGGYADLRSVIRTRSVDWYPSFLARSVEERMNFHLEKAPTKNLVWASRNLNFREGIWFFMFKFQWESSCQLKGKIKVHLTKIKITPSSDKLLTQIFF